MQVNFSQKAIIVNEDSKLLALKADTWDLPGGKVQLPDLHSSSLRNKVKAQTGIEIWDFQIIGIDSSYDPATDTYHIFAGYVVTVSSLTLVQLSSNYSEFGWFKIKDFMKLEVPLFLVEFVNKAANAQ